MKHKPSAVLYARVSSKEQEREGYSIAAQRKLLRQYATDSDLRVLHEFVDVETAKDTGRKAYTRMVAFLHDHPGCRILLVEKTDRLYRNLKDWVRLDDLQLTVHFVKEGAILSPESRSNEKFMHGIRVLMAKNYIDNLSEEVKKGLQEKVDQGHWPTVAPVGYLNNRRTHLIERDPDRAPAITHLFERYATGDVSLKQVTATAFTDGLTHPRSGRRLVKSEIHRMLHNPIFYGAFRGKGKLYAGNHDPIVSKDLFDAVQAVFASANKPRYRTHRHAFAGLLTCGVCGCAITAEIKKSKYVYYHCTGYRGRCGNTYIREEDLASLLGDVVRRVQIPRRSPTGSPTRCKTARLRQRSSAARPWAATRAAATPSRRSSTGATRIDSRGRSASSCGRGSRRRGRLSWRLSARRWPSMTRPTAPTTRPRAQRF